MTRADIEAGETRRWSTLLLKLTHLVFIYANSQNTDFLVSLRDIRHCEGTEQAFCAFCWETSGPTALPLVPARASKKGLVCVYLCPHCTLLGST